MGTPVGRAPWESPLGKPVEKNPLGKPSVESLCEKLELRIVIGWSCIVLKVYFSGKRLKVQWRGRAHWESPLRKSFAEDRYEKQVWKIQGKDDYGIINVCFFRYLSKNSNPGYTLGRRCSWLRTSGGIQVYWRPPFVVSECPHWGCGVKTSVWYGSYVLAINGCPRWRTLG